MASTVDRITKRAVKRVPYLPLRWGLRLGAKLLFPLAGALATAGVQRLRNRSAPRTLPDGTVIVEINRELGDIAPQSGDPAEPLMTLAERAHLTLSSVPGRGATCLRAVPKRTGDDIRAEVTLAKQQLDRNSEA
ncbi:MAG: hypothetical protein HOW97_35185, partial [Catenulispora sp.]|nr:hypothetical protein [Catenulispora sp.]